ncbi:MAG: hypothetical protein WC508_05820 [Patescibacteria group bacterium]
MKLLDKFNGLEKKSFLFKPTIYNIAFIAIFSAFGFWLWHLGFNYYFFDEWGWLMEISQGGLKYFNPHNEHILPISKLFYLFQLYISQGNTNLMLYPIIAIHLITSLCFGWLIYLLLQKKIYFYLGSLLFMVHFSHFENIFWGFQAQIILNVLFLLLSLILLKLYLQNDKYSYLITSYILLIFTAFTFGSGLLYPILIIIFFLLFRQKHHSLRLIYPYILIFYIDLLLYIHLAKTTIFYTTGIITLNDLTDIAIYFFRGIYGNIPRSILIDYSPKFFDSLTIGFGLILATAWIFFTGLFYKKEKIKYSKLIIFGYSAYCLVFLLLAPSRFVGGFSQSFTDRYHYLFLAGLLILIFTIIDYFLSNIKLKKYKFSLYFLLCFLTFLFLAVSTKAIARKSIEISQRNAYEYNELMKYYKNSEYNPNLYFYRYIYFDKKLILDAALDQKSLNPKNTQRALLYNTQ